MSIWAIVTKKTSTRTPVPTPTMTTPPSREGPGWALVVVAIVLVVIVGVILSRGDPRDEEMLGVQVTAPAMTTVPTAPPTTTPPPTTPAPTTTTTTVPPREPPLNGFYIIPEELYAIAPYEIEGSLDEPDVAIGFILPVGTEIRSPIAGEVEYVEEFVSLRGTNMEMVSVFNEGEGVGITVVGRHLQPVEGAIQAGDVLALVVSDELMSEFGKYNIGIALDVYDDDAGYITSNTELLCQYFLFVCQGG